MPLIYPPLNPTLSGDVLTINRFLASPTMVNRYLRTIAQQSFLSDVILTGRVQASGGAIAYGISESIYTDRIPEAIRAGSEYPRALAPTGAASLATITKWGQDVKVTDEEIGRTQNLQPVDRSLRKVVNQMVFQVDSVCLAAIAAAITQTQAAAFAWNTATADPFLDTMLAVGQVLDLAQGYDPDTIVLTTTLYARLVANQKVIAGLSREAGAQKNVITESGDIQMIAGLAVRPVPAARMPSGTTVMVLDSTMLGAIGYEQIPSPEYQGDPGNGIESWVRRDPDANDSWLIRGRRPVVPVVQEPACAVKITGA
jgi:hypothetical protein